MSAGDTLAAYAERINRHDFDLLVELIAPDAVFWFSDGSSHRGIDAIRAAFEETWKALNNDRYEISDVVWLNDDACRYRFDWKTTIDGKLVSGSGRGTTVFRRTGARWLIVHEHLGSGRP